MKTSTQNQTNEIIEIINEIVKGINQGETIVFCGAGISKDSGFPIVNQLVPYILEKLKVPEEDTKLILDKYNYPKIPFEAFMQALLENSSLDRIFDIYNQGEPNTNHILLAKLIKAGKLKTIVTTNFDKLIEKALSMKPKELKEGKDYDIIYKVQDFENINWLNERIRIIKIHGSVDDKYTMALTLKHVASQILLKGRKAIIEEVFSKGIHNNVLIMGYSSSDMFDLSPQIQAIDENHKKVYYIQHADSSKVIVEDIQKKTDKNPFKKFKDSKRLYYNTGQLIKNLWESIFDKYEPYVLKTNDANWKENVDEWYRQAIKEHTKLVRYFIPAYIFIQIGEFKTAIEYHEQALKIAQEIGDKRGEEVSLGCLGNAYENLGEYNKTIKYYKQALKIAQEIGDKQKEGALLGNLGVACYSLGEYNKAIKYHEQALKIAQEIGDKQTEGLCIGNLGITYHNLRAYSKAIQHHEQALKIAQEIGDKQTEGTWLGNLGIDYWSLGVYSKAIKYLEQALKIAQEIVNKQNEGTILGSLGNAYFSLGEFSKAIKYHEQALKIAQEIGDKQTEGLCIGNLGNAYYNLGEYSKAIQYHEQALKIVQEIGDKQNEGVWLGKLGSAYGNLGEYNKAIEYYEQALNIAQEIGDKKNEGVCLLSLGKAYGSLGEYSKTEKYLEQALKIAQEIGDKKNEG